MCWSKTTPSLGELTTRLIIFLWLLKPAWPTRARSDSTHSGTACYNKLDVFGFRVLTHHILLFRDLINKSLINAKCSSKNGKASSTKTQYKNSNLHVRWAKPKEMLGFSLFYCGGTLAQYYWTWSSWLDSQFSVFFVPVNNVYLPIAQQHSLCYGESYEQYECPAILLIVAYYMSWRRISQQTFPVFSTAQWTQSHKMNRFNCRRIW